MAGGELSQKSARGGVNALLGQLARILIQLISLSVLARLLGAEEYGLLAMVMVIVGIADVFRDFGLSTATIQAEHISTRERSNLWWLNTVFGLMVSLVMACLSPVVAWIYQDDRLLLLSLAMSASFFLSGMSTQYFAHLQREMRFGVIAVNGIFSGFLALGCAVYVAWLGWGVWALVIQALAGAIFTVLIYILQTRWFPGRYDFSVSMKRFIGFGAPLMLSNLLMYLAGAANVFILGKISEPETVGYFNRANQSVYMPLNQIRTPLSNVAFSALSKRQNNEKDLARFAEQGQIVIAYPIVLLAGGLAATGSATVALVLGPGWENAVPFFIFLAIAEGLNTLAMTAGWLFMVRNKTASLMKMTLASVLNRLVFIVLAILIWGSLGAAIGTALAPLLQWPFSLIWAQKATGVSTRGLMLNSYRIATVVLFCSLVTYGVTGLLEQSSPFIVIGVGVLVQCLAAASCAIISPVRRDYKFIFNVVKVLKK